MSDVAKAIREAVKTALNEKASGSMAELDRVAQTVLQSASATTDRLVDYYDRRFALEGASTERTRK